MCSEKRGRKPNIVLSSVRRVVEQAKLTAVAVRALFSSMR